MYAAWTCHDGQMVKTLLEAGADPNAKTKDNFTPLMWATGNPLNVEELLMAGAAPTVKNGYGVAADFKKTFSRECKPHFVGVWDTVSSVGWVYNAVHFPFTKATNNSDLQIVRHAISIDERRAFFCQNLFGAANNAAQDIREVWFAGVHSDVGGSYPEAESQLSKIALRWIVCEAELAGLVVDPNRKKDILGGKPPYVSPDPDTGNQHESLHGFWWIAELWPKVVRFETASGTWKKSIRVNVGRRRWIAFDSCFHESVEQRLSNSSLHYRPSNLPEQRQVIHDRCGSQTT
jgi:uncharacterized protein (DUF2235 family)